MKQSYSPGSDLRRPGFLGAAVALAVGAALALPGAATAKSGGPDVFGYTFKDSNEPGGPVYNFVDIQTIPGHSFFALSDDQVIPFVLPFEITVYGVTSANLSLGNNGSFFVNTLTAGFPFTNTCLSLSSPSSPRPFVAALWDDPISLTNSCSTNIPGDGGPGVYLLTEGTAPHRKLTMQWHKQFHFNNTSGAGCLSDRDVATWQCILFEDSDDILFQYEDTSFSTTPTSSLNDGASATIGIRGMLAGEVLQYSCNEVGSIKPHQAIRYYAPLPPPDCNGNGIDDALDITSGFSTDCNIDGVPDECSPVVETVTLRTGNGPFSNGAPDTEINVLSGPADGPFGAAFTSGQFISAASGNDAIQKAPVSGYLPSTNGSLPADGLAHWVTTTTSSSGLYAHSFTLSSDHVPSAQLFMSYASDAQVGSTGIPGIYLNGQPITCAVSAGSAGSPTNLSCNTIAPLLIPGGTNTLYVYGNDSNGGGSGIIYSATILIRQPELSIECKPATVQLGANGLGTLDPDDMLLSGISACGPVFAVSVDRDTFDCDDLGSGQQVELTAENTAGNVGTCKGVVTVVDLLPPTMTNCPASPFTQKCNHPDGYLFVPEYIDNCSIGGYDIEADGVLLEEDGALPFGTYPVTVTVYDASGNSSECNFTANILPDVLDPYRVTSDATFDGTVTEPDLNSLVEGSVSSKDAASYIGDTITNHGSRAFFHFDTSVLPEDATIIGARLRLTRTQVAGNPSTTLGRLILDMNTTHIGTTTTLAPEDYEVGGTDIEDVSTNFPYPAANAYVTFAEISEDYFDQLGTTDAVQFRVRFENETNSNGIRDAISIGTGNSASRTDRPELIVEYYIDTCFSHQVFPTPEPTVNVVTLFSLPANDGGVSESHFTSEVGGAVTATATTFPLGDTPTRQQLMGVVSFDTSSIPEDSTITLAELRLFRTSQTGAPGGLGGLTVDMRNPYIPGFPAYFGGAITAQVDDFQAYAHFKNVASIPLPLSNTFTSWVPLNTDGMLAINRGGTTQMKLRFNTPDDGDALSDQIQFAAAEFGPSSPGRPTLRVTYQAPAGSRVVKNFAPTNVAVKDLAPASNQ